MRFNPVSDVEAPRGGGRHPQTILRLDTIKAVGLSHYRTYSLQKHDRERAERMRREVQQKSHDEKTTGESRTTTTHDSKCPSCTKLRSEGRLLACQSRPVQDVDSQWLRWEMSGATRSEGKTTNWKFHSSCSRHPEGDTMMRTRTRHPPLSRRDPSCDRVQKTM